MYFLVIISALAILWALWPRKKHYDKGSYEFHDRLKDKIEEED